MVATNAGPVRTAVTNGAGPVGAPGDAAASNH